MEGIHHRGQYDLGRHEEYSGKQLKYFDDQSREKVLPAVIETSAGASRQTMMVLANALPRGGGEGRPAHGDALPPPRRAPEAAVLPLVKRDGMPGIARRIEAELRPHLRVAYDEGGAIGRRYRRMDEAGTPFCVTVDSQTLEDETVTLRERDSMAQERVGIDDLLAEINRRMDIWKHPDS